LQTNQAYYTIKIMLTEELIDTFPLAGSPERLVYCSVLPAPRFHQKFLDAASCAKQRVWLKVMTYNEDGFFPQTMTDALAEAARRGLDARFQFDSSIGAAPNGPATLRPALPRRFWGEETKAKLNKTLLKLREMEAEGVETVPTNLLNPISRTFPLVGRDHIKMAIVDDTAWVMGMNLTQDHLIHPGVAYETNEPHIVGALENVFKSVNQKRESGNYEADCTPGCKLIVDRGNIGSSLIYDRAVDLVKKGSDKFTLAAQLLPQGRMLKELIEAAKMGSEVFVITSGKNNGRHNKYPYKVGLDLFRQQTDRLPNIHLVHSYGYLHVKVLHSEEEAIIGSHNFSSLGVMLGTREASLQVSTPNCAKNIRNFTQELMLAS
jgi:phosphatidylserine/phosphatidylglycerophosphate/cardiolipin synthase-like enzyme